MTIKFCKGPTRLITSQVVKKKEEEPKPHMPIELGLSRIKKLLSYVGNPHETLKVLHIAGTNGKGSVCSYLSTLLQYQRPYNSYKIGRFTTPHLLDVTDSITLNDKPISRLHFDSIMQRLEGINTKYDLKCSEFELLTCVSLLYFKDTECDWCVLEVGLGGRLDATNVVPGSRKLACGITKVALDHELFLGDTLSQIAREKAGIITEGVKCAVVDGSNVEEVLDVIRKRCEEVGCSLIVTPQNDYHHSTSLPLGTETKSWDFISLDGLSLQGQYQLANLRVALGILDYLQGIGEVQLTATDITKALGEVHWPGRLQRLDLAVNKTQKLPILLDGAHNGNASTELAKFLRREYHERPLTLVMAVTKGKNLKSLLDPLIRPCDRVITTKFGPVDGMPWVHPTDPLELAGLIRENYSSNVTVEPSIQRLFEGLKSDNDDGVPIVVCGSLYLCGEILRLHNSNVSTKETETGDVES